MTLEFLSVYIVYDIQTNRYRGICIFRSRVCGKVCAKDLNLFISLWGITEALGMVRFPSRKA